MQPESHDPVYPPHPLTPCLQKPPLDIMFASTGTPR